MTFSLAPLVATTEAPRLEVYEVAAVGGPEWKGEPISLELYDVPITEALRAIAKAADLIMVAEQGLSGDVTVVLDRVPWDQALHQVRQVNQLVAEREGKIWRIHTDASARQP